MASLKERYNRSRTSSPAGRSYAGIGSRDTPEELIPVMEGLGRLMAEGGYQLRSGHAAGADQAFYRGWQAAGEPQGLARIYLPWSGFPGSGHLKRGTEFTAAADDVVFIDGPRLPAWNQAMDLAVAHHPQGEKIRQVGWGKLQGRNSFQVLGDDLASPADLVIAYRNPTAKTSGTDQALKIAAANNIPVLNLADPAVLSRAQHALQSGSLDGLLQAVGPAESAARAVPMSYVMPLAALRPDLRETYGRDASTLELIQQGQRQATTRNPFAKIGEVISFENDPTPYVVTEIRKPDLQSPEGRKAWEDAEGWDLNYIDQDPKLRAQVYSPRAVQTFYRRADQPPAKEAPQAQPQPQQLELPVAGAAKKADIDWGNVGAHTGAIVGSSLIGYTIADLLDQAEREGWR
jgi:hypothetical protein